MTSEAEVINAVLDLLQVVRVTAFRCNTGAVKIDDRFVKFGTPGFSDILAIPLVRGQFKGIPVSWCEPWFLEIKSATGRQTAEQKSFERLVKNAGAQYFLVRSSDELREILFHHGVIGKEGR